MKCLFYCGIHNLVNFSRLKPYYDVCYGFDANPEIIEQARKVYQHDPTVHIIYGALTDQGGQEIEFTLTTDWTPASSVGNPNPEYVHMKTGVLQAQKKIVVPAIHLYNFCVANGIDEIDTLITDLQGIDLTVLKTMAPLFQQGKIREIQCEVEPDDTPQRYLGIPPSKFKEFKKLLSEYYDVLWINPAEPPEGSWEMDVRWRIKGAKPLDDIEFVLENELLVTKIGPNSSLTTYSQYGEDRVLAALFKSKPNGFYVDIGANDPDVLSNTKLFYCRGWHGINVEPEPGLHVKLCAKRDRDINLNVGVGPEPGIMTFYRMSADTLSSFNKQAALQAGKLYGGTLIAEEPTPVVKLADILAEHLDGKSIDFLSVDAEGYDLAVLESNDWSRFRPSVIIVEINVGGDEIITYLRQQGYTMIFNNGTNGIFISKLFFDTIDDRMLEDLAKLEQKHNLEMLFPCAPGRENLVINFVYGHLRPENHYSLHKGRVSIIWSTFPVDGCDVYVYHNAFSYKGKRGGIDILATLEPAVVLPGEFDERVWSHFDYVLTLFDSLTERGKKYRKIYFPHFGGQLPVVLTEMTRERIRLYPTSGRRNAVCMINGYKHSSVPGELYSVRTEIARWFHDHSDIPFDVFGSPPFPLPNYKGPCDQSIKLSTLKQYRYCLCFENTSHPVLSAGYVTEKILDCLETRTIPIYLGASNVERYIPAGCFIDFRKFGDYRELDEYLHRISDNEYQGYIDRIDEFVCRGGLRKYSAPALYDEVVKILIEKQWLDRKYFISGRNWKPGLSPALSQKEWKVTKTPEMWTWKYLSKAQPPLVENGKIIERPHSGSIRPSGSTAERGAKSFLIGKKPSIKLMLACVKYSYGNARRGYDYGWWNMCDTLLHRFNNIQTLFFDYVTEAQQHGVAGMSDRLVEIVQEEKPDVLFYSPFDIHADILHDSLRFITDHTDTQTLIWMSDDQWRFDNYSRIWAPCVDHIITTAQEAVGKYCQAGFGEKVIKSQWAFNPFTYQFSGVNRSRDVSFVGMAHGNRPEIIEKMRQSSLRVDAFGLGWSEDVDIPFRDMARIFCQSRINLNLSNSSTITTQQIKGRNFEVPGCRGFLITTPADDLDEYYEPDKEVVIASSMEELIDKSRYYLTHERKREEIAQRGYERTLAEHTWTHRFVDIFKRIGFAATTRPLPQIGPSPFLRRSTAVISELPSLVDSIPPSIALANLEDIQSSIIVNAYNQLHYTKLCVESILHYTAGSYELILVDNGSTDGTFEYFERVKSFHHKTRVIRNVQNRNVEATFNHAYSMALGKYLVSVTNDTRVHEGWLDCFIKQIESAPDIGLVGPRSNCISGPQAAQADYDTLETYQSFAAEWSANHRGENFPVHRMVGMFTIAQKVVLERIGGLDPDIPTNGRDGGYGFSDDDISLRLTLAGYKLLVANDVFIHHYGSVTASKYRPDLFGPAQNINKEKYLQKLRQNDRITIETDGKMILNPYNLDDVIPIDESTVIRTPQICFVETKGDVSNIPDAKSRYSAVARKFNGDIVEHRGETIQSLVLKILDDKNYDFLVLIDSSIAPSPEVVSALTDTALCYPDVAVMVPIGSYAPSTHAHSAENGKAVEIIQYADMSFCVINVKIIRPFIQGLTHNGNDGEFFWFLQRRIRGESYFIVKANNIIADSDVPCSSHPYDSHPLPEKWVRDNKYVEAIAVYKDDLSKDPTFAESLYQLAYIAKEQHQSSEAIQYAQDALQIDSHHIQSLLLLSRIFLEQGDLKRAQSFVSQANMKQPGNPEVQKVVELYEAQLKGQAGIFQADAAKEISSLIHPEFVEGLTSIIIPVQSVHLNECISSINKYTNEPHEVIFLDHGAAPKLKKQIVKALKENYSYKAAKIDRKANFTQSLNVGINQSSGEYIVLLFDDVMVGEGWLSDMHACLHNGNTIGIVGAMSNDASSLQRIEGLDFKSAEARNAFRERNRHRRIQSRYLDGFCMLLRRDLLTRIGLFDERFIEDKYVFDDFCVRAVLEGYNNIIAGNVFVHSGGGINRLLSRDKTLFDEKWIGLDASTPLAEKVSIVNAMETARSQYQKGIIEDAVNILILRIGFSPNEKQLYFRLAEILLAENRFQDAIDALKEMSVAEDDAEYYALLGYGNEGSGFYPVAEEYVDKALAIDGKSAPALNLKGILAYRKDDAGKAEEYFRSAIEADPGYGDPYTHMGMLRWKTEQREEAVDLFEKGFILSSDKGDIITGYYTAISSLIRYERAETVFREARTAYPENKRILFLLIDILLKQDKFQEAMKEVQKAMVHFGMDEGILSAALEIRRKIGAKTVAVKDGRAKPAATLSVCMIVKNEEQHLAYCLNSLSPVADEMIVVDTGSTDKTKEIAEAFGAHVYDFEWVNDFAVARNCSLSKAQGDWILVMDADEVISFQDHAKLKKLVDRKDNIAYNLTTRNYVHKTAGDGWVCNDNSYIYEQAGRGWFPSSKVRLFPNNENIRFEKPIHELVEYSMQRIGLGRKESGIPVHHYGELDTKKATAKDAQYYDLGVQKLKESGGDFRSVWELAVQAGELGKTEESIELWHKVLGFKHKEAAAYFNLANHYLRLGKYADSYDCSRKSYALDPMDQSAVLSYAMSEFLAGDINKTIAALEGFLKGTDSQTSLVGLLAVSCLISGKKDRGLKYLRGLVRKKYDCVYYLKDLSQTLIAAGNLARAKSLLATAIEIKFYDQETSSLLAQCEAGAGNDCFVEQKM